MMATTHRNLKDAVTVRTIERQHKYHKKLGCHREARNDRYYLEMSLRIKATKLPNSHYEDIFSAHSRPIKNYFFSDLT